MGSSEVCCRRSELYICDFVDTSYPNSYRQILSESKIILDADKEDKDQFPRGLASALWVFVLKHQHFTQPKSFNLKLMHFATLAGTNYKRSVANQERPAPATIDSTDLSISKQKPTFNFIIYCKQACYANLI